MLKMMCFFHLFFLYLLVSTAGQESVEILTLYDPTLEPLSPTDIPIAVSLPNEHLNEVSTSVINAETWLRTHVLPYYPSTNITTIVAGHTLLCNKNELDNIKLILPSMKNIYYSLTRWGLETEIKLSASLCFNCLQNVYVQPILHFLEHTNSPYSINPPPGQSETLSLVNTHIETMKQSLGFNFNISKINVIITSLKKTKPTSRKLSFIDPIPARPNPLNPTRSPIGNALPPLVGSGFPPPAPVAFPPMVGPANPPYGLSLPPCNPFGGGSGLGLSPSPVEGPVENGLWCVAKPSVPAETLQEAMDYACGEGGADCEEIQPRGTCYFPDSLVAHASYAFNSYWQKKKKNGGTCGFGGTAMLINSDPSFRHCRFILL